MVACCLASAAVFGSRLDLVPSLTAANAGMALLLRMCSALILSTSAVAVAAATRWPLSGEEAASTPTSAHQGTLTLDNCPSLQCKYVKVAVVDIKLIYISHAVYSNTMPVTTVLCLTIVIV